MLPLMRQEIERLGIGNNVVLPGIVDRQAIMANLKKADIFLFCHKTGESPRCLGEALAAGCPLVGYGTAYSRALVATRGGGEFAEINDWQSLGQTIVSLDQDRDKLEHLIQAAAASGALRPGETLPSIRPLAEELRVNRNTVAKAYSELESLGVIETLPGRGCFLKENHSALRKEVRRKLLIVEIDQAIVQAHHLQVPGDEFLALVRQRMDVLNDKRRSNEINKED